MDWGLKVWDSLVVSLQYVFPGPATQAQACFHTTACQTHHGTAREVGWLCVIQPTSRRLGESRVQLRVSKWSKADFYIIGTYTSCIIFKNIYIYIQNIWCNSSVGETVYWTPMIFRWHTSRHSYSIKSPEAFREYLDCAPLCFAESIREWTQNNTTT